jgi:predicted DNA-binding transcriptional regulator AlpA
MLTAEEGAAHCGVALPTFWRNVAAGRLPAPVYPAPRAPRWRKSWLDAALDATRALPAEAKAARRAARIAAERDRAA